MLTKGLIIYPKNQIAKKILYNAIGDKEKVKKEYLAFCENNLSKKRFPSGLITGFISKNNEKKRMNFFPAKSSDKPTIKNTKFCSMVVKREFKNNVYSLFSIILHTGRKHQIRSMFSFFKLPIIGDKKYGSQIEKKNKIFLFAYKISFFFLPFPLNYLNNKTFQFKLKKGFK